MKNLCISLFFLFGLCLGAPSLMAQEEKAPDSTHVEQFSHESKKLGKKYFLFSKEVALKNSDKVRTMYYFANADNKKGKPVAALPDGKMVSETKTGMLVLKNKASKKK